MEFLIKMCIRLIKIVFEIIEGIIRALLEILIPVFYVFTIVTSFSIGGLLFVRYGPCIENNACLNTETFGICLKLAGCAFTLYAAYDD